MKHAESLFAVLSVLLTTVPAWAAPAPPIPVIPTEVSEVMPPSDVDTPVPLPSDEDMKKFSTENAQNKVSVPVPTPTPTPAPIPVKPTPKPMKVPVVFSPTPSPMKESVKEETVPVTGLTGGLFDYFPVAQGPKTEFTYLKAAKGEAAPKNFTVQCVEFQPNPDGTEKATFESTQSGSPVRDRYLVSKDEVGHTQSGDVILTGESLIKMPVPLKAALWKQTRDGLQQNFKATLGPAKVFKKSYPDCVIVEEKDMKDGKKVGTFYRYYAKGIGLISLETYSADLKLIQPQSFALTQ